MIGFFKFREFLENVDWQNETRGILRGESEKGAIKKQLEIASKNKERMKVALNVAELIREDRERVH